jgi:peptide/nickel transport system substrate-binding protein
MTKLSRRHFSAALAASAAAAAIGGGRAFADTPKDTLVIGHLAELKTLDPATSVTISDFRILANIYDGVVRFKPGTLDIEPCLAKSWEVSPDGKTYTFKLRDDVWFHDGSKFDASSLKFNFDRVTDKTHPFYDTGPFPFVFVVGPIARTEAPDPATFILHLSTPYAPLLRILAGTIGGLAGISPASVQKYGKEFAQHGGGSGPFMLKEWVRNQRIVLEANKKYWDGAPKLAGLVFQPIEEDQSRISAMLSGATDLTIEVPPDNVPEFKKDPRFVYYEQPGGHTWYLMLNCTKKPFDNKLVRQALNYAINKQAMVTEVLKGTATVSASVTPPAFAWAYDSSLEPYPYDPAKAKALLSEAGYPNGVDVTFYVTQNGSGMLSPVIMGTALQADLAAVGIRAKIETYEWNTFLGRILPDMKDADIAELSFMTADPDTHPSLALRTGSGVNAGHYSNPEVDKLIDEARIEMDPAKRGALYKKMQAIVHDDAPWGFICHWKQNAVAAADVKDYVLMPDFSTNFHRVYKA